MTDQDDPKRQMFGQYRLKPNSGVNPPYSPAYPVEWGCALRTVEIMTRVAPGKVKSLLADTPFEIVGDRVAFRFMLSPGHSMAVHAGQMFDLMIEGEAASRPCKMIWHAQNRIGIEFSS